MVPVQYGKVMARRDTRGGPEGTAPDLLIQSFMMKASE
jgi:hypothetical protein